jgi:DNA-damage-inducible protein D
VENNCVCFCVASGILLTLCINFRKAKGMDFDNFKQALDEKKRLTDDGIEYWMARDIQPNLGYDTWQYFEQAIERAKKACESSGVDPAYHFSEVTKEITAGKGAQLQRKDMYLSRYACSLIAMNSDSRKAEVAMAQTYFAIQTRKQERFEELTLEEQRIEKRLQVKDHNKQLASTAQKSGVPSARFGIFQDRGYLGLYNMPSKAIKAKKGIPPKDNLLDYAGSEELAANDFRITQTHRQLIERSIKDEWSAQAVHEEIGRRVRLTIEANGNPMPEGLPIEPHIKVIQKKIKATKKLASGAHK